MAKDKKAAFTLEEDVKPKAEKPAAFYCMRGEYVFTLPVYEHDDGGDIVMVKGRPKKVVTTDADGNNPHGEYEQFKFDRLPIKDRATGKTSALVRVGVFLISPEFPNRWERKDELRDYLNNARKNKHSYILTEDEYKLQQNPEFFHSEKEVVELQNANDALQRRNDELMEKLEAQGISFEK
jgi:hypothetical protein